MNQRRAHHIRVARVVVVEGLGLTDSKSYWCHFIYHARVHHIRVARVVVLADLGLTVSKSYWSHFYDHARVVRWIHARMDQDPNASVYYFAIHY